MTYTPDCEYVTLTSHVQLKYDSVENLRRVGMQSFYMTATNPKYSYAYSTNKLNAYVVQVGVRGKGNGDLIDYKRNHTVTLNGSAINLNLATVVSDPGYGYVSKGEISYSGKIPFYLVSPTHGDMVTANVNFTHTVF